MDVRDREPAVAPLAAAGLLLAARTQGADLGLPMPSVGAIIETTGASRTRAYEVRDEVLSLLPSLIRPPGRPRTNSPLPSADVAYALRGEVLRFVMDHPGCVYGGPQRRRHSGSFHRFVLELRERHPGVALPAFAEATGLPLGTLEDWLRPGASAAELDEDTGTSDPVAPDPTLAKIETLLDAWRLWEGRALAPFGEHVRQHLRLDFSDPMIAKLLLEHNARIPKRRRGRTPDEEALRSTFETFFGGAQSVGDGTAIDVFVDGELHRFNLELMVDAHSGAFTGFNVSDAEDSAAVVSAFQHGIETTGEPPLALLLDNRPSNHTQEVDAALGLAMRIRSTSGRAQNKAHVEGAFGLFAQHAPSVEVDTADSHSLARQLLLLVATTFARLLNHRPRRDRAGRSRVGIYREPVTDEQKQHARERLAERLRKQELARQTRAARLDPIVCALLDQAFDELDLLDPERHFRDAIARYHLDPIVDAIAIFSGRRAAGTLPEGVDARYLLGIVTNVHHVHEADYITDALIRERLAARDRLLEPLTRRRDEILAGPDGTADIARALVDEAMRAVRAIDRHFWLDVLAELIAREHEEQRQTLFRAAARRIHTFFRVPRRQRAAAERSLARRIWPLQ